MKKLIISLLSLTLLILISSCRPSYMRCTKNRRCVVVPVDKLNTPLAQINISENKQVAP